MPLGRTTDWVHPGEIKTIKDVEEYIRTHFRQHVDESVNRIDDFGDQEITTDQIADDIITNDHIADDAITTSKLYALCVEAEKIATGAIEEAKIAADAVTALKINVAGLNGTSGRIAVLDVTDANVVTAAVNAHATTLIAPGKVLISGVVNLDDWSHGTDATYIDGGKVYTNSITATEIAALTITAAELGANCITGVKIQADAVTATKINVVGLSGASGRIVVTDQTDADVVTAGINSHAVTLINAGKILISGAVPLSDWSHATDATLIDGGEIYTNSITATQIAANTITVSELDPDVTDRMVNFRSIWSDDFDTDTTGDYTPIRCTLGTPGDSIVRVTATDADFYFSQTSDFSNCDGGIYQYIIIRYKYISGTLDTGNLFYKTSGHGFSGSYHKSIQLDDDGEWHTDIFDMHVLTVGTTDWKTNTILNVRFDPADTADVVIDVDFVGVATKAIGQLADSWQHGSDITYIDGGKIYTDSVTATQILANTITVGEVDFDTQLFTDGTTKTNMEGWIHGSDVTKIDGGDIYTNTITATQINAGTITADEIEAGTITVDELILNQRMYWHSMPSAQVRNSNNTEQTTLNTTYEKIKETKLNEDTGKLRIYFQLKTNDAVNQAFAKIYKNGVALGTERTTVSESYVPYNQDLGAFSKDDLLQIYAHRAAGGAGQTYVQNFQLLYDRAVSMLAGVDLATPLPTVAADHEDYSVTNQDP